MITLLDLINLESTSMDLVTFCIFKSIDNITNFIGCSSQGVRKNELLLLSDDEALSFSLSTGPIALAIFSPIVAKKLFIGYGIYLQGRLGGAHYHLSI